MKKTLLMIVLVAAAAVASAQNKMWLGGTLSYSSESYDPDPSSVSTLEIGPSFGYMLNDKIAIGLGLDYYSSTHADIENGLGKYDRTTSAFTIAPFARMYKSLGETCSIYGELEIGFGSGSISEEGTDIAGQPLNTPDQDFSLLSVGVAPGIQFWFAPNWSVNAEWGFLQYQSFTYEDAAMDSNGNVVDDKTSDFSIGLDLSSMSFGLNYHF